MALKINAGETKRGDYFFVDPNNVIVKEDLRGRHKPVTDEAIIDMAISFSENGQRQAVECRRVEDQKLQLNLGFTRTNAARLLREGFEHEGETYHDPEFMLKVQVVDCNDKEAFINNVVENAHRNQTSDVDDAVNQRRLRDKYGYSDADIARLYRYKNQNKVGRLRQLLQLDDAILDMVHDGRLPTQAALDLLDAPSDERAAIIAEAEKTQDGKVKGSSVRTVVRDHILNDDNKTESTSDTNEDEAPKGAKPRTLREIRNYFGEWAESEEPALKRFAKDFLKWANGGSTDKAMDNGMWRILEAEPSEDEEPEAEAA